MKTNIIKCIAILMLLCLLPTRMWADEFDGLVKWDLTTNSYSSEESSTVVWTHPSVTMTLEKANSNYDANKTLGGGNNNYTKFYSDSKLSIIPQTGHEIITIVFSLGTNNNANSFSSDWTHSKIENRQDGNKVIITNNDYEEISTTIGGSIQVLDVTIYCTPNCYTRTGLQPGDYATMCLPFGSTDFTGAEFYNIAGVTKSGDVITGIALESVSVLEAGKPYIFKATGTQQVINLSGACQETPVAATGLVGNLSETAIVVNKDVNAYIIGTDNLLHLITGTATANIKQYRAYIKLDDVPEASSESPARLDIFDASAIHNITNDADQQQEIFDLQGRKLTTPQQGLNVIDGKKVIINK